MIWVMSRSQRKRPTNNGHEALVCQTANNANSRWIAADLTPAFPEMLLRLRIVGGQPLTLKNALNKGSDDRD
jgi:hypothetical protein